MRFIDSHVHVCEYTDPTGVIRAARSCQTTLVSSGIDMESSVRTLRLAEANPGVVVPFIGVHPSEAGKRKDLSWVPGALPEAAGVGEIGLDAKYSDASPMREQAAAFDELLSAAERAGKPVQVHSRGAERECLDVLSSFRLKSVLLHWFQAEERLREASDRGYYVSFGPALLTSAKLQRMAMAQRRGLVLVETDGPVPFAALGGASGPTLIPSVAFRIAETWGVTFQECAEQLLANGLTYLGSRTKG